MANAYIGVFFDNDERHYRRKRRIWYPSRRGYLTAQGKKICNARREKSGGTMAKRKKRPNSKRPPCSEPGAEGWGGRGIGESYLCHDGGEWGLPQWGEELYAFLGRVGTLWKTIFFLWKENYWGRLRRGDPSPKSDRRGERKTVGAPGG